MRRLAILLAVVVAAAVPASATADAPSPRIVGGAPIAHGDWSSVAAILGSGDQNAHSAFVCGGTLIAPQVVMTAAHCVAGTAPWAIQVVVGVPELSAMEAADRVKVRDIVRDPAYDAATHAHDVALVLLDASAKTAPMPLVSAAQAAALAPGAALAIAGWGSTVAYDATAGKPQSTSYPDDLQTTGVSLIDDAACAASDGTGSLGFDASVLLCAGDPENGGHDACTRDSGGPLAGTIGGARTLVGVISFGVGCCQAEKPGFYTRVGSPAILSWVLATPEVTAPAILRVTNAGPRVTVTWTPPASSWAVDAITADIGGADATVRRTSATATVRDGGRLLVGVSSACGACGNGGGAATWSGRPTATTRSTAAVRITGAMTVGRRLKAAVSRSDPWADVRYQWRADGRLIARASGATYRLRAGDAGRRISVVVRVRNAAGVRTTVAAARRVPSPV
ncbi:MAG: S1 family serine peptidase [Gaiellales bacterium]